MAAPMMGKEYTRPAQCPFCGLPVERPLELTTRRYGDMPVGTCSCGAVYACDATGHNMGSAFIEALVFACDMDWDLAWSLLPREDYSEKLVEDYDLESHQIIPGRFYQGRRISGGLFFVRMHRDIREATSPGVTRKLNMARAESPGSSPSGERPAPKPFTKKEVEDLVSEYRVLQLVDMAAQDKRIMRDLKRLLYSGDPLVRSRAAEILGKVSSVIARKDPGSVSNLLMGLINSVSSPGASSWGALEAIGEIIAGCPDLYAGYIPLLYNFLGDSHHRPGVLGAIGRVAEVRPDLLKGAAFRLMPFLQDPDPGARGYAALLFGSLGMAEAKNGLNAIRDDAEEIKIYKNGIIAKKTVGQLGQEALERITAGS